jgi:hypothetical protein
VALLPVFTANASEACTSHYSISVLTLSNVTRVTFGDVAGQPFF